MKLTLRLLGILFVLSAGLMVLAPRAMAADPSISQIGQIGGYDTPPISEAQDVAVDTQGNIYVFDGNHKRVIKYDSSGEYILTFGTQGSGNGQFGYSYGIATDSQDNVYVADTNNNRIQKFDSEGNYLSQFGTFGNGNGEFNQPYDLVIDTDGDIYVADSMNARVQKFNSAGEYQLQFEAPADSLALDASGNIYVAGGDQVQKFDSLGELLLQVGSPGGGDGQLSGITGIATDDSGNIFVLDNARVQKFDSLGAYQSQFGSIGEGDGMFDTPRGLAIDANENIYVADTYNDRIQKFSSVGVFVSIIGVPLSQDLLASYAVAYQAGRIYIPVFEDGAGLRSFTIAGQDLATWTYENVVDYIVATSPNYIYALSAVDGGSIKLRKISNNGQVLDSWDVPGMGYGIAADSQDNVYWLNQGEGKIVKFSSDGEILYEFGSQGSGDGQFDVAEGPAYLAVDGQDNLYVGDSMNFRIQKFDSNGNFLMKFGSAGTGQGQFTYPAGIAVNSSGDIYVSDLNEFSSRIQKFTSGGIYQAEYSQGVGEISRTPYYPYGLSAGPNGRIFVNELGTLSLQVLCDHDVSSDNCQSTDDGGNNSSQSLTYPDPVKGSTVTLVLPSDVTNPSVSAVDPKSLPKDSAGSYPAGLTSFQFTTTPGATKTVTLYYDLPGNPSDYTARKYKTDSQTYLDIPGATITREDYNGKSMLKLTYDITDGGILDQDGAANGTVIDPVGLATTTLADTGSNLTSYILAMLTLMTVGGGMVLARRHRNFS